MADAPAPNGSTEALRLHFREHWIRLVPTIVSMLGASIVIGGGAWLFLSTSFADTPETRHAVLVIAAVAFGITQLLFVVKVLSYYLSLTIITTRRVQRIHKSLFFTDNQSGIEIMQAQDTNKSQRGLLPSLLGFGSILIRAEKTTVQMDYVPHVDRTYEALLRLLNEIKLERAAVQSPSATNV